MKRTQLYMWMYMHVSSLAVRCDVRRTHSDNDVSKGAVLDYRVMKSRNDDAVPSRCPRGISNVTPSFSTGARERGIEVDQSHRR